MPLILKDVSEYRRKKRGFISSLILDHICAAYNYDPPPLLMRVLKSDFSANATRKRYLLRFFDFDNARNFILATNPIPYDMLHANYLDEDEKGVIVEMTVLGQGIERRDTYVC